MQHLSILYLLYFSIIIITRTKEIEIVHTAVKQDAYSALKGEAERSSGWICFENRRRQYRNCQIHGRYQNGCAEKTAL